VRVIKNLLLISMNFYQLSFGFFSLKIYGILLSLAFIAGAWNYYKRLQKRTILVDFFLHHFWKWVLGAIIVGRIFAILLEPGIIEKNGIYFFLTFWDGGINFYGSLIGCLLTARWDLKKHGYTFSQWIDIAIPSILLGILITDIAAFLTGATYGKETTLPWGIQYQTFGVDILNPVHPISLYAFFIHLWLLYWTKGHEKTYERFPEKLAIRTGILFFMADFFLQFLYGDKTYLLYEMLRIEQIIDLVIIIFLVWRGRRKKVL